MLAGLSAVAPEPKAPPATESHSRLLSAGVEDTLEKFNTPELLAAGKISIISLEAVEARLGARWELRRDAIYEFTKRVLERGVSAGGFFIRVSPTDFLVVQPDLARMAGLGASLRFLREVLTHFLGDDSMASTGVMQVTSILNGRLEAKTIDGLERGAGEGFGEDLQIAPLQEPGLPALEGSIGQWSPFIAADGRPLRVSATLEPVYELKNFTRIGFRLVRRVLVVGSDEELSLAQIAKLSTADLLRVDLATMVRGLDRLKADGPGGRHLSLIVPMSFTSLSSQRGRSELIKQLKIAGSLVKLGIICEICGIDGVPPGALLAASSLVRPFTLLLMGHVLNSAPAAIGRLQGSGLKALSLECPPQLDDLQFNDWSIAVVGASRRVAKSLAVYGVGSARRAGALAAFGASHVSLAR